MEFARDRFGRHEFDTGSPALQAAAKCDQLIQSANHMRKHHNDINGYINFTRTLVQRRKWMLYLKRTNFDKYCELLAFYKMKDLDGGMPYQRYRCKRH